MKYLKMYWSLSLIVLVGLVIRFYNITSISLWHDEAFSALLIKYPFSEMMYRIGLDVHPPLYYIFLRFWSLILGNSLLALRGFSLFFGVGTIILSYAFVKKTFQNKKAALITASLVALNAFQIQYVSEARMYTMGAFFALLATFFLISAHQAEKSQKQETKILYYIAFAFSCGIMILTHYYLLFTALSLCFYALVHHIFTYKKQLKQYGSLFAAYILIALSFLPYLKTFLFQYKQVGAGYWIPPMDFWSIPTTLWHMFLAVGIDITKTKSQILVVLLTLFSVYFLWRFIRINKKPEKWLVLIAFLAPFLGSILFAILSKLKNQDSSVYLVRYFIFASTFYVIALASWLASLKNKTLFYSLFILYLAGSLWSTIHYWSDLNPSARPGMNAAAKFLKANVEPNDKIYIGSSFEFFNYKYYNSLPQTATGVRPLLFSGGNRDIKNLPHFAGTAILTNEDLLPEFSEATKSGDTVWLIWTNGFGGTKPEVPQNYKQIGEEKIYPEIRPYVGTNIYINQYKVN